MSSCRPARPLPLSLFEREGRTGHREHVEEKVYRWVRQSSIEKQDLKPHDLRGTWYLQANPGHVRELAELIGHLDLS